MSAAAAELAWLLKCLHQQSAWREVLSEWEQVFASLPEPCLRPQSRTQELAAWLLAFSDLEHASQEIQSALKRDPDPPFEWVIRALRHLPFWIETGRTPFALFYSLRRLHFLTRMRSSWAIALLAQALQPFSERAIPAHLLALNEAELAPCLADWRCNSVVCLPRLLPKTLLSAIREFAERTPCRPSLADREHQDPLTGESVLPLMIFEPTQPLAHRYDFDSPDLWSCEAIQELAADPLFPWLAGKYLGAEAALSRIYLWWSTAFDGPQSRYTGQVYHIDLDRFHFVNFFIYITDVTGENGPQQYVLGSHQEMQLSWAVDQRWSDDAIYAGFPPERHHTICGPAGTVICADTQALHKGRTLNKGTRLMLQFEFASCSLGENVPWQEEKIDLVPNLVQAQERDPWRFPTLKIT